MRAWAPSPKDLLQKDLLQKDAARMPRDLLQKVLGWPVGNERNDNAILLHLSAVREKVLDRRYRAV